MSLVCVATVYTRVESDNFWLNFDYKAGGSACVQVMLHCHALTVRVAINRSVGLCVCVRTCVAAIVT